VSCRSVAILLDPVCQEHDTGKHIENRSRLQVIEEAIEQSGLRRRLLSPAPRPATVEQIATVHTMAYIEHLQAIAQRGGGWIDADTVVSPGSYRAALAAAGCAIAAVDVVLARQAQAAFALVRPPGHHARPNQGKGFCLFNNIAIATRHALDTYQLERVLIVDFDAHHGNGTQETFYESQHVLYFSTHLFPFYPGTGLASEIGAGAGSGYTVNVPVPALTDDFGFRRIYGEILVPLAQRYRPQMILVSAGYDVHWADPLTYLGVSVNGIANIVAIVAELADSLCQGRMVFTLEGGYDRAALAASCIATLHVLLGDKDINDPLGPSRQAGPDVSDAIAQVKRLHAL